MNKQVEENLPLVTEDSKPDDPLNKYLDNREEGHINAVREAIRSKYFAEIKKYIH